MLIPLAIEMRLVTNIEHVECGAIVVIGIST